jgi:hypothetical protein
MGGHGLPVETQNSIIVLDLNPRRSRTVFPAQQLPDDRSQTYMFQFSVENEQKIPFIPISTID